MKKKLLFSWLIAVFSVISVFSQVTTSKIQGVVSDDASTGLFGCER